MADPPPTSGSWMILRDTAKVVWASLDAFYADLQTNLQQAKQEKAVIDTWGLSPNLDWRPIQTCGSPNKNRFGFGANPNHGLDGFEPSFNPRKRWITPHQAGLAVGVYVGSYICVNWNFCHSVENNETGD